MSRSYNIEIVYERTQSHTAKLMAVCALLLVLCATAVTGTFALEIQSGATQTDQIATRANANEKLTLVETWNASDGVGLAPGSTVHKEPAVTNNDEACSLEFYLQIKDGTDGHILSPDNAQDAARLELIKSIIWADAGAASGLGIQDGKSYTTSELAAMSAQGSVSGLRNAFQFGEPAWDAKAAWSGDGGNTSANAGSGAYVFKYTGGAANTTDGAISSVFANGDTATLFNHIVIPSDYTADQLALLGNFSLIVWAKGTYDVTPVTPDPVTPGPVTPDPVTPDPVTPDPEPTTQPATDPSPKTDPATEQPATPEPATTEPTTQQPTTPEPSTAEPATSPATTSPITENNKNSNEQGNTKGKLAQTGDVTRALMAIAATCATAAVVLFVAAAKLRHARAQGGDGHEAR